ncbi:sensor histidine kinase [Sandaracinobacter neustonicus]|uniref:histidine kinase n=2 Tax=Sandaracinobacter neustonicus TaxID=1715348 RepID=A0A501XH32_9SPHN|nr:sensor histidine kinase [Sandaracinobacter neustonicus]HBI18255.1 histidine kinase [Brevundimonas sp.]
MHREPDDLTLGVAEEPSLNLSGGFALDPSDRSAMRARVDAFDWSSTPLGPREAWPAELKIIVRQILDSHFPKAIVWGPELITIHNDAFLPILGGKPEALGRPFSEVWAEVWDEIGPIVDKAYAGESTYIEDFPLSIDRSGVKEDVWFTFCYSPLRRADGSVAGMLDTVIETTGKVRAQADLALANQELAHRLGNTLALVQAIASQTLQGLADEDALASFGQRLGALGKAHDVLVRQSWSAVSFLQVVRSAVEPHDHGDQIRVEGPDLKIGSRAAVSLALLLHELATNAVKYGALSVSGGTVGISWAVEPDELALHWRESGGPPVEKPRRIGFGTRLIKMGLSGGTVERRFEPDGFKLDMTVSIASLAS